MTTVELWVNGFDASSDSWTKIGSTPYLDAQDQPTNYVYSSARNTNCGLFTFQQRAGSETINSVVLYIYSYGVATNDFECYLGATPTGLGPPAGGWAWKNIDVSTILTTWSEINTATLLLDRRNTTNEAGCDATYLLVDYVSGPTNVNVFDGLTLSDGIGKERRFTVSDGLNASDGFPRTDRTYFLVDSASLIDTILKQRNISAIVDSVGLMDSIFKERFLQLGDSIGLGDSVLRDKTILIVGDALSLGDSVDFLRNLQVADSLGLLDDVNVSYGATQIQVFDSISLGDTVFKERTLSIDDNLSLVDSLLKERVLAPILDAVGLSDSLLINKSLWVFDSVGLVDSIMEDKTLIIGDTVNLSEAIIKHMEGSGWTGVIIGIPNPEKIMTIPKDKIKKVLGIE